MADDRLHTLRSLEERLERVSEATQRLMEDASGTGGAKPPPSGWQSAEPSPPRAPAAELESLLGAIRSLREVIPVEVAERLIAAVRELLLAIRALIDFYLERLERRRREPPEVQDIPID